MYRVKHLKQLINLFIIVAMLLPNMVKATEQPTYTDDNRVNKDQEKREKRVPVYATDRILIKYKEEVVSRGGVSALSQSIRAKVKKHLQQSKIQVLEVPKGKSANELLAEAQKDNNVEYAEPIVYFTLTQLSPNDPLYPYTGSLSKQRGEWGLNNSNQERFTIPNVDIDAPQGWATRTSADNVIIGVIDTGVRYTHEDLKANMWTNPGETGTDSQGRNRATNGIDDDGNGYIDDLYGINATLPKTDSNAGNPIDNNHGHGTHVAGTIAAVGNNGKGITGVAWKAKIMAIKTDDENGYLASDSLIDAIDYAIAKGAKVINASWGGHGYSRALYEAFLRARAAGIIFAVAAGNDGTNNDIDPSYPAAFDLDNIVTVASYNYRDKISTFSNYSPYSVDLAAPGEDILSTYNGSDTDYQLLNGTSMATPHVAGALALLRAQFTSDNYFQTINRLYTSTRSRPALNGLTRTGGLLNLANALSSTSTSPFNNSFAKRLPINDQAFSVDGNNISATAETGEPQHAGTVGGKTVWWSWTPTQSGPVRLTTTGSSFDTVLAVYTGSSVSSLTLVASNNDAASDTKTSKVDFNVVAGTTYQIAVDGANGATGSIKLQTSNDNFINRLKVTTPNAVVFATNDYATKEAGEPNHAGSVGGRSLWWTWTSTITGSVSITTRYSNIDTVVGVYTGDSISNLSEVASNNNDPNPGYNDGISPQSRVTFNAVAGTDYHIAVDSVGGTTGYICLQVPPTNDLFNNSTVVNNFPAVLMGSNFLATKETGEPSQNFGETGNSVWWSWQSPVSGPVTITGVGSRLNHTLAVYTGDSVSNLTLIGANLSSSVKFNAVAGTIYRISVDGGFGGPPDGSWARGFIKLSILPSPIAPTNVTASIGSSNSINLNWTDNSNDEIIFIIERSLTDGDLWEFVESVAPNQTTFTDKVSYNTSYLYRVVAVNESRVGARSNVASLITPPTPCTGKVNIDGSKNIYLEAESYSSLAGSRFKRVSDSNRSGKAYMQIPQNAGSFTTAGTSPDHLVYNLNVTNGGTFYIWLLVSGPDSSSDSFWLNVDSGSDNKIEGFGTSWSWKKYSSTFNMSSGARTFRIKNREDGSKVDKILFTKSSSFTPSGTSNTPATNPCTDSVSPSTPTGLTTLSIFSSEVRLTWSASTDNLEVRGYKIFRNGTLIGTTTGSNITKFIDKSVSPATTYSYTVKAYDSAGNESASSTPLSVTTPNGSNDDTESPTAPTNLYGFAQTSNSITLNWTASTDNSAVKGYQVFRDGKLVGTSTTTDYTDTGLTANTSHSYYVKAYDAANNLSDPSNTTEASTNSLNVSVNPTSGSGSSKTFTFTASSLNGSTDITRADMTFAVPAFDNNCYLSWFRGYGTYLLSDDGSTWIGPIGTTAIGNSQCSVSNPSVTESGNNVTLTIPITFNSFSGTKTVSMYTKNSTQNTGYVKVGTWTIP
jgi:subtilisin family serine protease/chitodextrinase